MDRNGILEALKDLDQLGTILNDLSQSNSTIQLYGLTPAAQALIVAGVYQGCGRPGLVVTPGLAEAERLYDILSPLLSEEALTLFPALEVLPYEVMAKSTELTARRLKALESLADRENLLVITPVAALLRRMPPVESYRRARLFLRIGDRWDLESLLERLIYMGYERVDMVEGKGQLALRGGILDLFPLTREEPVRCEFFDDEVDSLRFFDVSTQRSKENIREIMIPPAREMILDAATREKGLSRIREVMAKNLERLTRRGKGRGTGAAARWQERAEAHLERLTQTAYSEVHEQYAPFFYPEAGTFLNYLSPNAVVFLLEPNRVREAGKNFELRVHEEFSTLLEQGALLPEQLSLYTDYQQAVAPLDRGRPLLLLSGFASAVEDLPRHRLMEVKSIAPPSFHGQWTTFVSEARSWKARGYRIVAAVSQEDRGRRLVKDLREENLESVFLPELPARLEGGAVYVTLGSLEEGVLLPEARLAVVTDKEIFGVARKIRRPRGPKEARLTNYQDLHIGDYVVHINHGIGKYLGIQSLVVEGVKKDYLFVKYAGEDRLYVPTDQLDLIQKYVGVEGQEPKLNRLGGTEWSRVKNKVKESVQQLARELLHLYALRESVRGHAFSPDLPWQKDFEGAFPYVETPDQLQATEEIKRDMEKPRPMDRLLCGDVGYGKTEVALRAAFKAVGDGKQVAVLVPTTILAQQHFSTFRERLNGFPVTVEVLSRFRKPSEQEKVTKNLRQGVVDIVIGTHRLLQEDVKFKDLGLVIVDEEQRFGVAHKERLKQLRASVDVLTLSATPIPRTLHMSLVGIRDMSVIETPPEDRFPVQTYVIEYSEDLIRDVIQREMNRGGQIYYVHNRIQDLARVVARVSQLVPQARIAMAHGQMKEEILERTMLGFLAGEYDILISTAIIESGLDIANVNTLIVEDADHFGLSQLYQLRGRVGRSNRLAYAYLTYRKDKILTEVAEKRLRAIREFTEFGSGFKIALRDLEIRGAGNILGPEQHGFIISVGFDLYTQLLDESIRELKGEKKEKPRPILLDLPVDAYIPDEYIADGRQKIGAYKKVAALETLDDVREIEEELLDRYGELPPPVQNLLALTRIRILAGRAGATSVEQQRGRIVIRFLPESPFLARIPLLVRDLRARITFTPGKSPYLTLRANEQLLTLTEELFSRLCAL
ncbi:MAG: transcription-repair coupling factor [Firmicutes bacterium]|nr:transcription-repair coupling factor [Bacillota bacterium]MCL5040208.1 transcription-repair coupling factor [Bacillota bacterium]